MGGDFFVAWGRALARHGRGLRGRSVRAELAGLHAEAERTGLKSALPPLEVALGPAE